MNIFQNTTEWMRKGGSSSRPFPLLFNFSILVARITAQDQILAGYIPQLPTLTKCWHPSNKIIILTTTSSGSCSLPSFPGGSDGKESVCNAGDLVDPWVEKIPWRREWLPTPVFLPGESHGQRSLVATFHWLTKSRTRLSNSLTIQVQKWRLLFFKITLFSNIFPKPFKPAIYITLIILT